jgi:formylglycine-generating enzyme required for sulfatase activity
MSVEEYKAIRNSSPPGNREQQEFLKRNPNIDTARWPVALTYADASALADDLNKMRAEVIAHRKYRLPTEAEWEYACRAGTNNIFIGSDTLTTSEANFHPNPKTADQGHIVNVASYKPNPWGLHDMLGNVREWCADWKGEYLGDTQTDPQGPKVGKQRVIRGGSAKSPAAECRASARFRVDPPGPNVPKPHAGIRFVCIVEP